MKTRIERRFADLAWEGRAGLVTFITAGDPDQVTSLALLHALAPAGADIIELGMPFSDPMADGPAIQAASQPGVTPSARSPWVTGLRSPWPGWLSVNANPEEVAANESRPWRGESVRAMFNSL